MATQAQQVMMACEKSRGNAVQLDYDPRNPFDICSLTFTPIYRSCLLCVMISLLFCGNVLSPFAMLSRAQRLSGGLGRALTPVLLL